jgi:hypothetical protein
MPIYRWQEKLLRRAAFGNKLARAKMCCCGPACGCPNLPNTLTATLRYLSSSSGNCSALTGETVALTQVAATRWEGEQPLTCGDTWRFKFFCEPPSNIYQLYWSIVAGCTATSPPQGLDTLGIIQPDSSCDPFSFKYRGGLDSIGCGCCGGGTAVTLTFEVEITL